jgi:SecD/SecF fusion protein
VNTSLVVLLPILSLLLFGGQTLKDFAFAMFVGVAIGAYSSIFLAAPVLTIIHERQVARGSATQPARTPRTTAATAQAATAATAATAVATADDAAATKATAAMSRPKPKPKSRNKKGQPAKRKRR